MQEWDADAAAVLADLHRYDTTKILRLFWSTLLYAAAWCFGRGNVQLVGSSGYGFIT